MFDHNKNNKTFMFVWFRGSFNMFLFLTAVFHCQLQLVVTVDQSVLQAWRIRSSLIFRRYRKSAWNSMNMTDDEEYIVASWIDW